MKKFVLVIVCVLLIALCFTACKTTFTSEYGENILTNSDFEGNTTDGWNIVRSDNDTTDPKLVSATGDYKNDVGSYYVQIKGSDYTGYTQTVSLEKDSYYYLSAKVLITSAISADNEELSGAFVAVDSDYALVSDVKTAKTTGWETIGVYFNSGNRTSADIRFGVGTETYNADGTANFDSVTLVKVEEGVPALVTTLSDGGSSADYDADYRSNDEGKLFMILTAVLGALVLYAAYAAFRTMMGRKGALLTPETANAPVSFFKSSAFILIICELVAFAVRLILINFVYGGVTLGGYVSDATALTDLGAAKYYFDEKVLTPIGSLYLLWAMGALAGPLNLVVGGMGFSIFLKIPAVLADLVIVFVIYYLANRKYNQYISAVFAGVYAIFPVFFFLSAGWGAYASLGALFILLSLSAILDKKYVASIVYYAVALLFSTEALLLAPLLLVYLGFVFFKTDDYKMGISIALTSAIIGLYLIGIPFILTHFTEGHPFIVVERYCQAFLAHAGFTENAFSIYGLFGLGASAANTASYVFNGIFVAATVILTIVAFFKSRSRLDLILLSAFTFIFTFVMTSAVDTLLIYPALLLLLVYGMISGDRRILKVFAGFSLTTLLNTAYAMLIGGYFGAGENSALVYMGAADPVLIIFSVANVLLLGYLAFVTYRITVAEDVKTVKVINGNYFVYAWEKIKACALALAAFCTKTIPALFKKKESAEDTNVSKGQ